MSYKGHLNHILPLFFLFKLHYFCLIAGSALCMLFFHVCFIYIYLEAFLKCQNAFYIGLFFLVYLFQVHVQVYLLDEFQQILPKMTLKSFGRFVLNASNGRYRYSSIYINIIYKDLFCVLK